MFKLGPMAPSMRVNGKRTRPTEKEDSFMQMVMSTTACGLMIRHMVMVYTVIWTVLSMKVIGRKISSMVLALRHGQMVPSMMVTTSTARNMDKVVLPGQMAARITVNSKKTTSRDMEHIIGLMEECS